MIDYRETFIPLTEPRIQRAAAWMKDQTSKKSKATALVAFMLIFGVIFGALFPLIPLFLKVLILIFIISLPIFALRPEWLAAPILLVAILSPSYQFADLLIGIYFLRALFRLPERQSLIVDALKSRLIQLSLLILLIVTLSITLSAILGKADRGAIYQDSRAFFYWLWMFAALLVAPRDQIGAWIAHQILFLTAVLSTLVVIQGTFDISLSFVGRVGVLETLGQYDSTVTRVQIPGFCIILMGLFLSINAVVNSVSMTHRLLYGVIGIFALLAILFNFGRGLWFWSAVGLIGLALSSGPRTASKLIGIFAVSLLLGFIAVAVVKPKAAAAAVDRALSITREGDRTSSFGWRLEENRRALEKLQSTHFLGAGLGGDYRSPVLSLRHFENHTRYIHNAHLGLLLKISVIGYMAVMGLFALKLRQAWQLRHAHSQFGVGRAIFAWSFAFLGLNITQPDIFATYGAVVIALNIASLWWLRRQTMASIVGRVNANVGNILRP